MESSQTTGSIRYALNGRDYFSSTASMIFAPDILIQDIDPKTVLVNSEVILRITLVNLEKEG